jgi:hypothetical protein
MARSVRQARVRDRVRRFGAPEPNRHGRGPPQPGRTRTRTPRKGWPVCWLPAAVAARCLACPTVVERRVPADCRRRGHCWVDFRQMDQSARTRTRLGSSARLSSVHLFPWGSGLGSATTMRSQRDRSDAAAAPASKYSSASASLARAREHRLFTVPSATPSMRAVSATE